MSLLGHGLLQKPHSSGRSRRLIFVTGVGRCGTSALARVLHEYGIACMGHIFDTPDAMNPQGYWEDLNVKRWVGRLFLGNVDEFTRNVSNIHRSFGCTRLNLGFKHPYLSELPRKVWLKLNPDVVYWCTRSEEDIVTSIIKRRKFRGKPGNPYEEAKYFYDLRSKSLEKNLEGLPFVRKLDFSEYRSDEWILSQV